MYWGYIAKGGVSGKKKGGGTGGKEI